MKTELKEFNELAYRAHTGTSFSPEKRRDSVIKEHEAELNSDLENIPEDEQERYISNYKKYFSAWLSAKSNCISSMIAGPARFPVKRAEKANQSEHNRYKEFIEWRKTALKAIAKRKEQNRPQHEKDNEIWNYTRTHILRTCKTIIEIDNGTVRGCSRPLFVANLSNRLNTIAKNGNADLLVKCLDLIKEVNSQVEKPVISKSHSIWKLAEQAEIKREEKIDNTNKPANEFQISNGKILFNHEADRLQILFDAKPDASTIQVLKKNAFKWAPSNKAWQRQLTNNAILAAVNVIGEFRSNN